MANHTNALKIAEQTKHYIARNRWTPGVKFDNLSDGEKKLQEMLTWVQGRLDEITYELEA